MSFTNPTSDNASKIIVPEAIESHLIQLAQDYGCVNSSEAKTLKDTHAVQQCTDAFVSSGFEPSAAVDKLADIAVESGYFKSKSAAKTAMKSTAEHARKKESNWTKLYNLLGL